MGAFKQLIVAAKSISRGIFNTQDAVVQVDGVSSFSSSNPDSSIDPLSYDTFDDLLYVFFYVWCTYWVISIIHSIFSIYKFDNGNMGWRARSQAPGARLVLKIKPFIERHPPLL